MTNTGYNHIIAWQGLQIPVREDWRPLKIEGDHEKGSITVGDISGPVFRLRWLRPPKGYDAKVWVDKRRKSVAVGQESEAPPRPDSFKQVSWVKNLRIREESEKTVWWGCSNNEDVLVEVLLTNLCSQELNNWFLEHALPQLKVISPTQDCPWQIYSARCRIPSGYTLQRKRLATGDMALEFLNDKRDRILVRQVYPAKMALARRSFANWLRDRVFNEHRRFYKESEQNDGAGKLQWTGWKRLPIPLGWIKPQRCVAVIRHDKHLDRLLMVESQWRSAGQHAHTDNILRSMTWS